MKQQIISHSDREPWGGLCTWRRLAVLQDWRNVTFCGHYPASAGNNEDYRFLSPGSSSSSSDTLFFSSPAGLQQRFRHLRGLRIHPETRECFHRSENAADYGLIMNKGGEDVDEHLITAGRITTLSDTSLRFGQIEMSWPVDLRVEADESANRPFTHLLKARVSKCQQ